MDIGLEILQKTWHATVSVPRAGGKGGRVSQTSSQAIQPGLTDVEVCIADLLIKGDNRK